jgi:signal transduction histidine kinase
MNLLEWARSQTNKITFNPEQLELREIVDETMFVLDNIARQKSISIIKDFTTDISTYADRHMLSTIVRNLVSNAIKFTPTGGEIVITAMQNASSTRLTVSDNGTGIPGEKIESLFTIGNNTSTLGTAEEEGTGLGLILCKEFVDRHGGILEVFSIPEKGSSFSVILPLS